MVKYEVTDAFQELALVITLFLIYVDSIFSQVNCFDDYFID
jgi:hypothetical protein